MNLYGANGQIGRLVPGRVAVVFRLRRVNARLAAASDEGKVVLNFFT